MVVNQKTLVCAAVYCAIGSLGTAFAAESPVIYGIIDTGLNYQHVDKDVDTANASNQLQMKGSQTIPNRFGIRGNEKLGNGFTLGYVLEGQFGSDDGSLTSGRLFHRVAQIALGSDYGTLIAGRSGILRSGFGTTGLWGPKVAPFSNAWGDYLAGSKYLMPGSFKSADNTLTYQSPRMSGLQFSAQWSGQMDSAKETGIENKSSSNRIWSLGANYTNGPLNLVAVLDSIKYATTATGPQYDDAFGFGLAANYSFDVFKLYVSSMFFKGQKGSEFQGHTAFGDMSLVDTYKGYSLQAGADVPALGGTAKVNLGWMDASIDAYSGTNTSAGDTDRLSFAVGYEYPLSKRTRIYSGAGYIKDTSSKNNACKPQAIEVVAGMSHRF